MGKRFSEPGRRRIFISIFCVLIVAAIVFSPCLHNDFTNWDDIGLVTENETIRELSWRSIKEIFSSYSLGAYVPLTIFSYAIEYHFFKLDPRAYHTTNVILHLLNCLLVFWLIYMLSGSGYVSFVTALLFGIHPLHVESVAWVAARKDVLYSFFFLGAAIPYLYYHKKQDMKFYYLSLALFILSVLAKGMAITLPVVLILFDYLLRKRFRWKMLTDKIPYFVIAFVFGIIAIIGESIHPSPEADSTFVVFDKILAAGFGIVFYLAKILLPIRLSCYYPYPEKTGNQLPPIFFLSFVIIVILIIAVLFSRKRTRIITFGALFFLITILPYLQLIRAGQLIADRYTYIPVIGLFFMLAYGLRWLYLKDSRYRGMIRCAITVLVIAVVGTLSLLTVQRCRVWHDSITLWTDVLKKYPNVLKAYTQRGVAYYERGELDKALMDHTQSIIINPKFLGGYNNRGIVYNRMGKYDKALMDFTKALMLDTTCVQVYNNRGVTYIRAGEYDKAINDFTRALSIDAKYPKAYFFRAVAHFMREEYDKSWEDVKRLEDLNYPVDQTFLDTLRKASRRLH